MTLPARTPSSAADGALDVLGEHVAAADDDDVLDPAAQHELAVEQVGEVAGAQPAVAEQRRGGVGALVVAGRDRRAAEQQLADVALGQLLAASRGRRPASPARAPACRAAAAGGRRAPSSASATSTGLATRSRSSTTRSTVSTTQPAVARRERAADRHLGHPERREHAAGREAERLGRRDERLDRVGVDRLGAAQRQRQRRQVEVRASASAPGWRAPTRSSARPWPCRGSR